jgi:hypothetical protein
MTDAEPRLVTIRAPDPQARSLAGFYDVVGAERAADIVLEPHTTIASALADFRDRITRNDFVQLLNVETLIERLTRLTDSALALPIADEDGPLAVEMWTDHGFDRVQITSLFGDVLHFLPPRDCEALRPIAGILHRWTSISATAWVDTLYRSALKRVTHKNAATAFIARGGDGDLLVRVTALFTALRAWHDGVAEEERRAAVADVAGSRDERADHWQVPVDLLVSGAGPGVLSGFEAALCVRYANDVLLWDGREPRYPLWLRA